jgi:1-aminocyclopropane-1-carboxylate deaminase/D-cysteine desulfhydrase-like pyridoxal-dependent ACC family enzyme
MKRPLLFERYPQLASIPWVSLAQVPTPVESVQFGSGVPIWVKRDDLTSPIYGGNKVRKLEFLLARARQLGARRLITAGAVGSHHALATAVFGRELEFDSTLVLFPQPLTDHVRQVLLTDAALGAELRFVPRMTMVPTAIVGARFAHWRERTLVIPPGGSDTTGTLGYLNAALELGQQIEQGQLPAPERIVVAAGTLGTAAGIAIGLTLLDLSTEITATRITSKLVSNERALERLIHKTCDVLDQHGVRVSATRALEKVHMTHDRVGRGYGQPTEAARDACEAFARAGLQLDMTYTAKAAADLLALHSAHPHERLLFWHTLSATMPSVELATPEVLPARFRTYLMSGAGPIS